MKTFFSTINILRLISTVPLLIIFLLSSFYLYNSYRTYLNLKQLNYEFNISQTLTKLSKELNQEKSMSVLYMATGGIFDSEDIKQQRKNSDEIIKQTLEIYENTKSDKNIDIIKNRLLDINRIRGKIDSLSISFDEVFFEYFEIINKAIEKELMMLKEHTLSPNLTTFLTSFTLAYANSNLISTQRDFVSQILIQNRDFKSNEVRLWLSLIRGDKFHYQYIPESQAKSIIDNIFNSVEYTNLISKLESYSTQIIKDSSNKPEANFSSYFDTISDELAISYKIQDILKNQIDYEIIEFKSSFLNHVIIGVFIWIVNIILFIIGCLTKTNIKKNISELKNILKQIADLTDNKNIDLSTNSGISRAYDMITKALELITTQKQAAIDANRSKSTFLANISHEIRTPLNGIIGFTDLLKNSNLKKQEKELVSVIEQSSENLLRIINNILDISKIESHKVELDNDIFSPIKEFSSAVELYSQKAYEKDIEFICYIDPSLNKHLEGDCLKVKQVLINLISNAVKFTPQNGQIIVDITKLDEDDDGKTTIKFSIKDDGIGIHQDMLEKIFDSFTQANKDITKIYGGTGLGLSISNEYIKMMGSTIKVQSELGKGSEFSFVIKFNNADSKDQNYFMDFEGKTVTIFTTRSDSLYDEYLEKYFDFLGIETDIVYDSNELLKLNKKDIVVAKFKNCLRIKTDAFVLVLANTKEIQTSLIEDKNISFINEPLSITKLKKALENVDYQKRQKSNDAYSNKYSISVLLATNNENKTKDIENILNELCERVEVINDAKSVIEHTQITHYSIIFLDMVLDEMNAVLCAKNMIQHEKQNNLPHTAIIGIVNTISNLNQINIEKNYLDDYIQKHTSKNEILRILNHFTPQNSVNLQAKIIAPINKKVEAKEDIANLKDVLLFKKSNIENKIFSTVLNGFCSSVDVVCSFEELKEYLQNSAYRVVLLDYKIPNFESNLIYSWVNSSRQKYKIDTKTIIFIDPNAEIDESLDDKFDEILTSLINKTQLEARIKPYIK
ncbi:ATP-binding protein [Campylobacter fetus]|uniref:ATP-binding protein n=1 Tax=Campylobacter fetus TaxID=196 RepID=UPI00073A9D93|nr:ATP-binding protein [Campylobacter fetus]ALV65269.1 NIT sensor-containing two component system histidine kinase/response regulator fusion protein [Campylobacter fetus subsp. testudinum Sp3]